QRRADAASHARRHEKQIEHTERLDVGVDFQFVYVLAAAVGFRAVADEEALQDGGRVVVVLRVARIEERLDPGRVVAERKVRLTREAQLELHAERTDQREGWTRLVCIKRQGRHVEQKQVGRLAEQQLERLGRLLPDRDLKRLRGRMVARNIVER